MAVRDELAVRRRGDLQGGDPAGDREPLKRQRLASRRWWPLNLLLRPVRDTVASSWSRLVEPHAVAVPGRLGRRGHVLVTSGMLTALDDEERAVLLAHERAAHLRHGVPGESSGAVQRLGEPVDPDSEDRSRRGGDETGHRFGQYQIPGKSLLGDRGALWGRVAVSSSGTYTDTVTALFPRSAALATPPRPQHRVR